MTKEDCFVFETFNDDLGTCLSDSPNREVDFRLCQYHNIETNREGSHIILGKLCDLEMHELVYFDTQTLELKDGEMVDGAASAVECCVETPGRNALAEQQAMLASMVEKENPKESRVAHCKERASYLLQGFAWF